jgi:hypothetical protein
MPINFNLLSALLPHPLHDLRLLLLLLCFEHTCDR